MQGFLHKQYLVRGMPASPQDMVEIVENGKEIQPDSYLSLHNDVDIKIVIIYKKPGFG